MVDKHLSTQFDSELNALSSRVMELGGLVESQIRQAIYALGNFSDDAVRDVMEAENRVNQMEVDIDRELSSVIARRQPSTKMSVIALGNVASRTSRLSRSVSNAESLVPLSRRPINDSAWSESLTFFVSLNVTNCGWGSSLLRPAVNSATSPGLTSRIGCSVGLRVRLSAIKTR